MSHLAAPALNATPHAHRPGGLVLDVALGCVALSAVLFLLVAAPVPRDAAVAPAASTAAEAGRSVTGAQIDMRVRTPSDSMSAPRPR